MLCATCGTPFELKRPEGRFCSDKCRATAWRKRRDHMVVAALGEIEEALRKARHIISGEAQDSR
ncbi:MAG: DUF2116 family Zn-ribbon domain-containing protein [candidate division NC10 bacterium]|nr:DUF2116 family Zn-ribbon domain-containing protein [candidate division NC10 bacterium]